MAIQNEFGAGSDVTKSSIFAIVGHFSYRYRPWVMAIWAGLLLLSLATAQLEV